MPDLCTVDDAKRWLDIDLNDATRDDIIEDLVTAASAACIAEMAQDPTRCTRTLRVNGYGGSMLPLNHYPICSVTSVTIEPECGGQPIDPSRISFDEHLVYLRGGIFPRGRANILITFVAGHDDISKDIILAVKLTIKAMWDARKTEMNATSENFAGIGGAGFWPSGPGALPPQALTYLARHSNRLKV